MMGFCYFCHLRLIGRVRRYTPMHNDGKQKSCYYYTLKKNKTRVDPTLISIDCFFIYRF